MIIAVKVFVFFVSLILNFLLDVQYLLTEILRKTCV